MTNLDKQVLELFDNRLDNLRAEIKSLLKETSGVLHVPETKRAMLRIKIADLKTVLSEIQRLR